MKNPPPERWDKVENLKIRGNPPAFEPLPRRAALPHSPNSTLSENHPAATRRGPMLGFCPAMPINIIRFRVPPLVLAKIGHFLPRFPPGPARPEPPANQPALNRGRENKKPRAGFDAGFD